MEMADYLKIFEIGNIGSARATFDEETGELWFCAMDVAEILGFENPAEAIKKNTLAVDRKILWHKESDQVARRNHWKKKVHRIKLFINESGLISMILGSKLEDAQTFRRWVTSKVLPSLLKSGLFILQTEALDDFWLQQL